jgi:hypothetical protein
MSTSAVDDSSASGAGASGSKFCLRAFELSFDYLEEISSVFANARAGGRSCTWEMLNNEDVLAAIEKQMLQVRYAGFAVVSAVADHGVCCAACEEISTRLPKRALGGGHREGVHPTGVRSCIRACAPRCALSDRG